MNERYYLSGDRRIFQDPFFKEFNLLFKNMLSSGAEFQPLSTGLKMPYPTNVWYNDEFIAIEIPVLRAKAEELEITRSNEILRVKCTRNKTLDEGKNYVSRGIVERDFDFQWKIPNKVNYKEISNTLEDGVLTIFLPIAKEAKPERIPILSTNENWKQIAQNNALEEKILDNVKKQEVFQSVEG